MTPTIEAGDLPSEMIEASARVRDAIKQAIQTSDVQMTIPQAAQLYAEAAIAAMDPERLRAEVELLNDWLVEAQMRAHKWMEAHDKLKAGKPYDLPSPADLPTEIASLREQVAALKGRLGE